MPPALETQSLPSDPQGSHWKQLDKEQLFSGEACPMPPQARRSRVTSAVVKVLMVWQDVTGMSLCLCHLPPKNVVTQSNLESGVRQRQTEGRFTKYVTSSHNCHGAQNKSSLRNSQPRGAQRDMTNTSNGGEKSWIGTSTEQRYWIKTKKPQ